MLLNTSFCQQSTLYGLTDQVLYLDLEHGHSSLIPQLLCPSALEQRLQINMYVYNHAHFQQSKRSIQERKEGSCTHTGKK